MRVKSYQRRFAACSAQGQFGWDVMTDMTVVIAYENKKLSAAIRRLLGAGPIWLRLQGVINESPEQAE